MKPGRHDLLSITTRAGSILLGLWAGVCFAPSAEDALWDYRFGRPGLDEGAGAVAWFRGNLYVGGVFSTAGHWWTPGVARWDGTNWWPVGEGLNRREIALPAVSALTVHGDRLYVGGAFDRSGETPLPGLAFWDGERWHPMPGLQAAEVRSLQSREDGLWVAGRLQIIGDTNWYGVARWDGERWETFDSRIDTNGVVGLLAVYEGQLFVSGGFSRIGGQSISYQARWDGEGWKPWPVVTNRSFWAMAVHRGQLFVSGSFTGIAGVAATNLACWDGTQWKPVGGDFDQPPSALISTPQGLFAAGGFTRIGSLNADGVARWDGTQWWPLGQAIWARSEGPVNLCFDENGRLFVVGVFRSVGGRPAGHVAQWTGTQWEPLVVGPSLIPLDGFLQIRCLAAQEDVVVAGGVYSDFTGRAGRAVWQLQTNTWTQLGGDFTGATGVNIASLVPWRGSWVVGGSFTNAAGSIAMNLARWTGSKWEALGGGTDGDVDALATDGTNLFVGGRFTRAGSVAAAGVAQWDGTQWSALGSGVNGTVLALTWAEDRLYAGGTFTNAGGQPVNRVAVWSAGLWQPLGEGVDGDIAPAVEAIAVDGTHVYVGGRFSRAGNISVHNLARWDGNQWHPVGEPPHDGVLASATAVLALTVRDGVLYVGGLFTNAGGRDIAGLARFDGTNWTAVGSGLRGWDSAPSPRVYALLWHEHALWVGGLFPGAGNRAADGLARWIAQPRILWEVPQSTPTGEVQLQVRGVEGLRFSVETSADLVHWSELVQGQGEGPTWEARVPGTGPAQFFRAVLRP
ncbi:hypothetical protein [Limisphaera sp. VF-2]|jgi:hypothetical protein|uniref:hypothetical protein n=1 Tax=Limisphaera sp. VF-2 TaxID=3400418 RepID=UPI001756D81F